MATILADKCKRCGNRGIYVSFEGEKICMACGQDQEKKLKPLKYTNDMPANFSGICGKKKKVFTFKL